MHLHHKSALLCPLQSGNQKGAECSEKGDSRRRHVHAPWIAEGQPFFVFIFV